MFLAASVGASNRLAFDGLHFRPGVTHQAHETEHLEAVSLRALHSKWHEVSAVIPRKRTRKREEREREEEKREERREKREERREKREERRERREERGERRALQHSSKVDPHIIDQSNNNQQSSETANSTPAALCNVTKNHHHFRHQERAQFIPKRSTPWLDLTGSQS